MRRSAFAANSTVATAIASAFPASAASVTHCAGGGRQVRGSQSRVRWSPGLLLTNAQRQSRRTLPLKRKHFSAHHAILCERRQKSCATKKKEQGFGVEKRFDSKFTRFFVCHCAHLDACSASYACAALRQAWRWRSVPQTSSSAG